MLTLVSHIAVHTLYSPGSPGAAPSPLPGSTPGTPAQLDLSSLAALGGIRVVVGHFKSALPAGARRCWFRVIVDYILATHEVRAEAAPWRVCVGTG